MCRSCCSVYVYTLSYSLSPIFPYLFFGVLPTRTIKYSITNTSPGLRSNVTAEDATQPRGRTMVAWWDSETRSKTMWYLTMSIVMSISFLIHCFGGKARPWVPLKLVRYISMRYSSVHMCLHCFSYVCVLTGRRLETVSSNMRIFGVRDLVYLDVFLIWQQ